MRRFPGLDGLRFLAALSVILYHVERNLRILGIREKIPFLETFFEQLGGKGVTLFFVLSGFLITHLLLDEKRLTGDIRAGFFYLKRALRILPLYYLLVLTGFFIFPHVSLPFYETERSHLSHHFFVKFSLFSVLMPNVALFLGPIHGIAHLWSIGFEQQFYLIWPVLMKLRTRLPHLLLSLIIVKLAVQAFTGASSHFYTFLLMSRFEAMAMGGLTAITLNKTGKILSAIFHPVAQCLLLSAIGFFAFAEVGFSFSTVLDSILFALLILNVACNPKSLLNLENPILSSLGKASYGMYLYHPMVIFLVFKYFLSWPKPSVGFGANAAICGIVAILTIVVSCFSYYLFERRFLKIKNRFRAAHRDPLFDPLLANAP